MNHAELIIDEARTWLGTPFKHQGRVKGRGVDCAGLIVGVAKALDIEDYTFTGYGREPNKGMLESEIAKYCIPMPKPMPGCILVFRFAYEPQHLAIYTDQNTIIHAYQKARKCIEHRLDDKWRNRLVSCWGYKWPS